MAKGSLEKYRYCLILSEDLIDGENKPLELKLQDVSKLIDAYSKAILTP